MSRSTKYILGGLAVVGGGLYYYELQVQQVAHKRKTQHDGILSSFQKDDTDLRKYGAEKGYQIGDKLENLKSKANNHLEDLNIPETVNGAISEVEKKKSQFTSAVADRAQDLSEYASDQSDKFKLQSKALYDEAHKNDPGFFGKLLNKSSDKIDELDKKFDQFGKEVSQEIDHTLHDGKSVFVKLGDKYIDAVNHVGIKTHNAVNDAQLSLEQSADQAQRDWNHQTKKLEKEADSWFKWGSDKKKEANAELNSQAKDLENQANSWFSWGSKKTEEGKNEAVNQYNLAKKDLESAKSDFKSSSKSWLGWGDKKSDELKSEAQKKIDLAQAKLDKALSDVNKFGKNLVDTAQDKVNSAKSEGRISEEELAQRSYNSLRGWGESAQDFAEDELKAIDSYKLKHPREINWADDVFTKTENLSKHAYESAKRNYHQLVGDLDKLAQKTSGWFSSQSKEVEKATNDASSEVDRQVEEAKKQLDKAQANLNSWLSKSGKTLVDYTTDAIDATKKGLDISNDEAQKGLTKGKEWVNDKK